MADAFPALVRRGRGIMAGFTAGQKAVTIIGIIALLGGGYVFAKWASAPTYAPLFSNISASDASGIVDQLTTDGVPYQLADGGQTILVPADKVGAERLVMSGKGLPTGGQDGYALLDKQGLTTSDFREQIDYQRALEGELGKTIMTIDGVQAAVVHLALPKKDVFADESSKATGSVLVSTRPGVTITSVQVQAIVNLVSSAVPDLAAEQVTVADATGRVLTGAAGTADGDTRAQQTQSYEDRVSQSLQDMLDRVVGVGHSVVRVSADLDYDKRQTRSETYVSNPSVSPLADHSTTETYNGARGAATGVLGPDNVSVPSSTAGGNGSYKKTSKSTNNAVGKVTEDRTGAPGTVRRLTVAVLLDAKTSGTVNPTQVSGLVQKSVGFDAKRGDQVQVESMPFDQSAAKVAKAELSKAQAAEKKAGLMSMARTVGLVLLVLIVLVLAFLSSKRNKRSEFDDTELAQLEETRRRIALEGSSPHMALESANRSALELTAPVPSDGDAERRLVVREEISDLVERQPDEVAQLLRGWLADRRN
jgi:flagellar M-ring protein FliF